MSRIVRLAALPLLLFLATALLVPGAFASESDEVTLEGDVACAKCTLGDEDAEECHNVLVVQEEGSEESSHYYFADTEASQEFGEVCVVTTRARVTGTVSEADGKSWIAPSKIERLST